MIEMLNSHFSSILIVALVFLPLERLLPRNRKQGIFRLKWSMDVAYIVLGGLISRIGQIVIITIGVICFAPLIPSGVTEFVEGQNIVLQALAIAFIADLWYYYAHRLCHRVPALWKFHAIHHSIEDMDWLAAHRVHPVDQVLTTGVSFILPVILGFSAPAFAVYVFFRNWHSLLKHSNVKVTFGIFSKILVSPTFHHWHHANQKDAYDKNFAGVFPVIDQVFGTAILRETETPEQYGVDDPLPDTFSAQMASPFLTRNDTETEQLIPAE